MSNSFPKAERLTRKVAFEAIMKSGKSAKAYPLRLVYLPMELPQNTPYQIAFGVGKRKFKLAVDRNRVKRVLREAWRHKKSGFIEKFGDTQYAMILVYLSDEKPSQQQMEACLDKILDRFQP